MIYNSIDDIRLWAILKKPYFIYMKQKIFLTRRYSNDIYKLIISICLNDAIKVEKNDLKLEIINIKKKTNLKFLLYCAGSFLLGLFFSKTKILNLTYKNIRLGKYLIAQTYRNYGTYTSIFKFSLHLYAFITSSII